jgi:DNA topoisomerase-1
MERFWSKFKQLVDEKMQTVKKEDITQEKLDEKCPKCGSHLNKRLGKLGYFIGCSAYPDCDYTRNIEGQNGEATEPAAPPEIVPDRKCPECGSDLHIKATRSGSKFIGCSNYPKCKFAEPTDEDKTGITCPNCQQGLLIRKKSRWGTYFYSCSRYPECKYAISNQPLAEKCPQCGWGIVMLKETKRWGKQKVCPQQECTYCETIEPPAKKQ